MARAAHDRFPAPGPLRARSARGRAISAGGPGDRAHRRSARLRLSRRVPAPRGTRGGRGGDMNATRQLPEMGQSLGLDNITHGLLASGTLGRYLDDFAGTWLTSNP